MLSLESPQGEYFQLKTPLVYLTESDRTRGETDRTWVADGKNDELLIYHRKFIDSILCLLQWKRDSLLAIDLS